MELCSFWVINPADGREGKPEPIKLTFFENGDIYLVSIAEDPSYRGAYKLPAGSYSYTGETLLVSEENLDKIVPLAASTQDVTEFQANLYSSGLVNDREWDLFYATPSAWKSLRIIVVKFGDE
ncbi:MAG: hypothetical protein ACYC21_14540 [Eubacteriales bacterium]